MIKNPVMTNITNMIPEAEIRVIAPINKPNINVKTLSVAKVMIIPIYRFWNSTSL